jgi:hypothetical protein
MTAIFFNLATNATFSLAAGLFIVWFFIWLFRVDAGPTKLLLLAFPFVKIVYDCLRGIPSQSVLFSSIDPFSLPANSQILRVGAGMDFWGPVLDVTFSVTDQKGNEFASSVGDYFVLWLKRTFGAETPLFLLILVGAISFGFLASRLFHMYKFEVWRRKDQLGSRVLEGRSVGGRRVQIYLSDCSFASPFTGGILKPYICFPAMAYLKLTAQEVEAVTAHELGHVRHHDLIITAIINVLGDLFWFVPGYRMLSRKIDRLREIVADQWAVQSGIAPLTLASALVKLKELPTDSRGLTLYSAFFREKSLLQVRVLRLTGDHTEMRSRLGWENKWVRRIVTAWIFAGVMVSTFGGNHRNIKSVTSSSQSAARGTLTMRFA